MNLGGSDYEKDKTVVQADTRVGIVQRDFGIEEWDWPQGVGLYGLYKLQKHYGDTRYMEFFRNWVSRNLEAGLPSKNINTTAPYLPLVLLLDQLEPSGELEELCREHADWLIHELPKTKEGGFQHTVTAIGNRDGIHLHNGQLWIDTLFMAVLFLNQAGRKFNRPEWAHEAEHQILLHIKYLFDKHTGLFFHGWSFERNDNFGSIFWCRGNSWFTYGITDYLEACQDSISPGFRRFLIDTYTAQVNALVSSRQLPVSGIPSCRTRPAMKRYPGQPQSPQGLSKASKPVFSIPPIRLQQTRPFSRYVRILAQMERS